MERYSILQVVAPAEFGGLEQVVRLLSTGLSARGHAIVVATIHDEGSRPQPLTEALSAAGIRVEPVFTRPRRYDSELRAIRAICRDVRPHVVHTHGTRPDIIAGHAARTLDLPRMTTVHGFIGGDLKNRVYEHLQVRTIRRFDRVAAVSRPLHDRLAERGLKRDRLLLIQNAWKSEGPPLARIEARRLLGLPSDTLVIGWVGRLSREKGPDVLVRSLPHLADLDVSVSLVGDGPDLAAVQKLASSLGVLDRIHLHGTVHNAARLYKAFDCFVLSSRTEGTPIVLFESMAAEVPVVATRVGGVADVVSDSESWLVEPADPLGLANAVREALTQPNLAAERARAARQSLERCFGASAWVQSYEQAYSEVARPYAERAE